MFKIKGVVIAGSGEGKKLGYPTANLKLNKKSRRPTPGVYLAVIYGLAAQPSYGLLVSGVVQEPSGLPRIEVYLLDWQRDIYGQELIIVLGERIRDIVFTSDIKQLKQIIEQDIARARKFFNL